MRTRTIALSGMVLMALTVLGCSKTPEEQGERSQAPASSEQKANSAPMQEMNSESQQSSDNSSGEDQGDNGDQSQEDQSSSQ